MSDYVPSAFWSYVRAGEYRTCDDCGVTQKATATERVQLHGKPHDRCKDKPRCARWKAELAAQRRVPR